MNRRNFLQASAAIILTPGLLMPVRKLLVPPYVEIRDGFKIYTFTSSGEFVVTEPTSVEMKWVSVNVSGGGGGGRSLPKTEGSFIIRFPFGTAAPTYAGGEK